MTCRSALTAARSVRYDGLMIRAHRPFTVLLLLVGVWTSLIAASIVPDPTWIAGVYDGADGDEIAIIIADRLSATPPADVTLVAVGRTTPTTPSPDPPVRAVLARPSESRGPPVASTARL
jgi:hypothetical protein